MSEKTRKKLPAALMLMLTAVVMSFAIAGVHLVTKDRIETAALAAQEAARSAVMADAADMTEIALPEEAPLDYAYEAYDENGGFIGLVSQVTAVGFGGEIEVTVGMDAAGVITGVNVGGPDFSETSGLGAKTREPAFTDQFTGKSGMLVLKKDIDSVTGASVSSGAVVSGVNRAVEYMKTLLPEGAVPAAEPAEALPLTGEEIALLLPGADPAAVAWMGGGAGIDGWWSAGDAGRIVRATRFGEGPIAVTVGMDAAGAVTGLIIGDENFMETEGRGDRIREDWYIAQFLGKAGPQAYGEGVDGVTGATVTSDAVLDAINACLTFDPAAIPAAAPAGTAAPDPAPPVPDAVTEASVPEEEEVPATGEPVFTGEIVEETVTEDAISGVLLTPDAVTEATVPEEETEPVSAPPAWSWNTPGPAPDAVTEASVPEETPAPAPEPAPDAVTEASVPEEG